MDKTKKLVILGAGFHGRHIASMVLEMGSPYGDIIFLDDNEDLWGKDFNGTKVLSGISQIKKKEFLNISFVVGVGNFSLDARSKIYSFANQRMNPISILHQSSVCSKSASIGPGTVLFPNTIVNSNARIGSNCVLYTGAIVEHDCILKNNVYLSTGVCIAGNVVIGENCFIGIGSNISNNIKIGNNCVVGAGAVVINDIPDKTVVVGVPAKPIKKKTF